jgi:hypothetical protein
MQILGKVVEIIGRSMVLIETVRPIYVDTVLKVFGEIVHQELSQKHGLDHLYIPKGEVQVVAKQSDKYCLAKTFHPTVTSGRIVEKPTSLLSGILSHEIVKEAVEGPPSASLGDSTIEVEMTMRVMVGDSVGTD